MKSKEYYVDPVKFSAAMIEYVTEARAAKEQGEERPAIPEYIGECFLKIATNMASSGRFVGYTYKDEMISDALLNCCTYVDRFNPEVSIKAFEYFSQICWYAFMGRVNKEKKEQSGRYRYIDSLDIDSFIHQIHEDGSDGTEGTQLVAYLKKQIIEAKKELETPKTPKHMTRKPKYLNK